MHQKSRFISQSSYSMYLITLLFLVVAVVNVNAEEADHECAT